MTNYRLFFWLAATSLLLFSATQIFYSRATEVTGDLLINEFMAVNRTGLLDEDGDLVDWIEIFNRGHHPVNLSGWALTDNLDQPDKWTFPDITLGSQEYLVIFASGKNRKSTEPASNLHTNFKLNRKGEGLALFNILDGAFSNAFEGPFSEQLEGISYGRYGDGLSYGYLMTPTPGNPNDATVVWSGIVDAVTFTHQRGFYDQPFALELTTTTPDAVIRYTLDGSEPTETNGQLYTNPIQIKTTSLVRAAAFKPGLLPSLPRTHTYIFLDDVLAQPALPPAFPATWGIHSQTFGELEEGSPVVADYEMDPDIVNDPRYRQRLKEDLKSIPSMSIVMDMQDFAELYSNPTQRGAIWERPASVEFFDSTGNRQDFQVNAGFRIQGGQGRYEAFPKHSFRLFFRGKYGAAKLEYPLFPDSPVKKFDTLVLRGGVQRSYAGKPMLDDDDFDQRLTTYTRDEWLRASQIAMSGLGSHGTFVHLYLNGLYWGLYNIVERPDESFLSAYLGGEKKDWQVINHHGPVSDSIERIETFEHVASGVNQVEFSQRYATLQQYLDTTQFIDYVILNWYAGNTDWIPNNWYAGVQSPAGQIMYFAWDAEKIWTNGAVISFGGSDKPGRPPNVTRALFLGLMQYPDFRMELADRLYKHLFNNGPLADVTSQERWLKINDLIDQAIVGESARWGDTRHKPPITQADWLKARDDVLAQMNGNANRLIALAREEGYYPDLDAPSFNQPGGLVVVGFALTMTASPHDGVIYYTTDGSDPRLPVTGAVAPMARAYSGPVVLTTTTRLKARLLANDTWSALNEVTFKVVDQPTGLRISEIMYNPVGGDEYEFIELANFGQDELALSNFYFDGIRYTFPPVGNVLSPGETLVLVRNPQTFAERYPGVAISGVYAGQLSNKGEKITLYDHNGNEVISVAYDDEAGWPISADGRGDSLILANPLGDPHDPRNWRASPQLHGRPGASDVKHVP